MGTRLRFMIKVFTFLLLLVPILELGVRVMIPQQLITPFPGYEVDHTGLGLRLAKNLDAIVNTGEGEIRLITDENGFRVGEDASCNSDTRILTLGDSFLMGVQVDYEQTTTGQLQHILSEDYDRPTCVINTGFGAYDPNHYLIIAKRELARASYDMVIVFVYAGNDFVNERVSYFPPRQSQSIHRLRVPTELNKTQLINSILYPINDQLERNSHLFVLVKDRAKTLLAQLGLTALYFPDNMLITSENSQRWSVTAAILADIVYEAAHYNIPTVIVLLPTSYQVDSSQLDWYIRTFDVNPTLVDIELPGRRLKEELSQYDIELLDPLLVFREREVAGVSLYGRIDTHLSPEGHNLLARILAPVILDSIE